MIRQWKKAWASPGRDALIFFKWLAIAALLGLVIGAVGSAFSLLLGWVTEFRMAHPWLLWLLPLGGLLIVFLYRASGVEKSQGTNLVLLAVRTEENVPLRMAPLIFISTAITHLLGGSAGREGAALQLGGSLAQQLGRWLHLDQKDMHVITLCGMSAGFSAVFGTPVAAAIFPLEVVSVGVMYYAALVPCATASLIAILVSRLFSVSAASLAIQEIPALQPLPLLQTLLLGILCAGVSFLFCKALGLSGQLAARHVPNPYLRIAIGGALVIMLTLLCGTQDYLGAGMPTIQAAMQGQARPEAFLLKIIFTAITLAAAYKGGEIVPTFFIGATFGAAFAPFLDLDASFGAGLSMVAVFCGVTNCPISYLIIGCELFGMQAAPYLLIVCAASYMLSGYTGLYSQQKILYSKFRPEFINERTKH